MDEATTEPVAAPVEYPPGDYAIIEIMGHTTMVGRIAEVEQFGTKMLAIEPLFAGQFLGVIYQGGASIYRMTPCSAEVAFREQPTRGYQLPSAVRKIVPAGLLEAPAARLASYYDGDHDEDDERDPEDFDPAEHAGSADDTEC